MNESRRELQKLWADGSLTDFGPSLAPRSIYIAGCSRNIGEGGVLVGRTQGTLSNGPTASPDGVPHTAPEGVTVHDAFPLLSHQNNNNNNNNKFKKME